MKITKLKLSFIAFIALCVGLLSNNVQASNYRGFVEATKPVITKRGSDASVTYTIKTKSVIAYFGGYITWDPALATLTNADIEATNLIPTLQDEPGKLHIQHKETGKDTATITLNFKNVLPTGTTANKVPINLAFGPNGGTSLEFGETPMDDGIKLEEIDFQQGEITLEAIISVAIEPVTTSVVAGKTQQFVAKLVNETAVDWSITGQKEAGTSIDANGLLTVDANEAIGTKIVVKATSKLDSSKSATAQVSVQAEIKPASIEDAKAIIKKASALDRSKYTKETLEVLDKAIVELKAVMDKYGIARNAQSELDSAVAKANAAYQALVVVNNTSTNPNNPDKPTTNPAKPGDKVVATGMNYPLVAFVMISGAIATIIVRKRTFLNK